MTHPNLDIRQILQRGGGPERLAQRSQELAKRGKLRQAIAAKTIYCWFGNGIPEKHWALVMGECDVTEEILHRANEAARKAGQPFPRQRGRSTGARVAA